MNRLSTILNHCGMNSLLFLVPILLGCGGADPTAGLGDPVTVTGTVQLDGKPVGSVEVQFSRIDGGAPPEFRNVAVLTDASGAYKMETVYPADYKVMIYDRSVVEDVNNMQAMDVGPYEKYGMESELKATVSESSAEHNFDLKK